MPVHVSVSAFPFPKKVRFTTNLKKDYGDAPRHLVPFIARDCYALMGFLESLTFLKTTGWARVTLREGLSQLTGNLEMHDTSLEIIVGQVLAEVNAAAAAIIARTPKADILVEYKIEADTAK